MNFKTNLGNPFVVGGTEETCLSSSSRQNTVVPSTSSKAKTLPTKKIAPIKILNVNVRSIKKNLSKLESLILSFNDTPDILCLTETWLKDEYDPELYLVNGYTQVK